MVALSFFLIVVNDGRFPEIPSQVLTLLTTPIVYLYMDRLGKRLARRGRPNPSLLADRQAAE